MAMAFFDSTEWIWFMKIYLATWILEPAQGESLTHCENTRRLLSYFHCKDKPRREFRKYVRTGRNDQ